MFRAAMLAVLKSLLMWFSLRCAVGDSLQHRTGADCVHLVDPFTCRIRDSKRASVQISAFEPCSFRCELDTTQKRYLPVRLGVQLLSGVHQNLFISVQENEKIHSWKLPTYYPPHYALQPFISTEHQFCSSYKNALQLLDFTISTLGHNNVTFSFGLKQVQDHIKFGEKSGVVVKTSPMEPWVKRYNWEEGVKSVLISVEALKEPDVCALFMIQNMECPVSTKAEDIIAGSNHYQFFTARTAVVASQSDYSDGIYIVILALSDRSKCRNAPFAGEGTSITKQGKTVKITVEEHVTVVGSVFSYIGIAVPVFIIFYLSYRLIVSFMERTLDSALTLRQMTSVNNNRSISHPIDTYLENIEQDLVRQESPRTSTTSLPFSVCPVSQVEEPQNESIEEASLSPVSHVTLAADCSQEMHIFTHSFYTSQRQFPREITTMCAVYNPRLVGWWIDIANHNMRTGGLMHNLGFQNVMIFFGTFMSLQAVALLNSYIKDMSSFGSQEVCYYNTLCMTSLGPFPDFSTMFSNFGYFMAAYFLSKIYHRHAKKRDEIFKTCTCVVGVCHQDLLFSSLVWGFLLQGIMSVLYHTCPNCDTIQFDMMFLYFLSINAIISVWGLRHGNVQHHVFPSVVIVVAAMSLAALQNYLSTKLFFIMLCSLHFLFVITIAVMLLNFGIWSVSFHDVIKVWKEWKPLIGQLSKMVREEETNKVPLFKTVTTIIFFLVNVIVAALQYYYSVDAHMYILSVLLVNLVLYILIYITTKRLKYKERGTHLGWITVAIAVILWMISMVFFLMQSTDILVSPAESRENIRECLLLNVFDTHDMWHLMSSLAYFFSFCGILLMDDDVAAIDSRHIAVF